MAEVAVTAPVETPVRDRHLRRNTVLGIFNGAMFTAAESLMSVDTVLTFFVQQLGGSNFLIGLVGPLRDAGWFLPQLFVSHRLQREPRKMPLYRRTSILRAIAWIIWTLAIFAVHDFAWLLLIFFVAYSVNSIASGFAGLPFMDIVAKTIPTRQRGSFFGGRLLYGSLLGMAASALVAFMLSNDNTLSFPFNIGVLFIVALIAALLGLGSFGLMVEPPGEVRDEEDTMTSHVRRAARLPRQNDNLRYFLITRVVLFLSYVAMPFYSVYSINVLGAPPSIIGLYVGVRTLVSLLINKVWARLSDRRGNKIVMRLAITCGLSMTTWALVAPLLGQQLHIDRTIIAYSFVPVFALWGLYDTGVGIGAINLLLEIAPGDDRAIYVGLTNTILGVAYISTVVSGLLVDWLGYQGVFIIAVIMFSIGLWAVSHIQEPRDLIKVKHAD